jgi:hypothetical protein
MIEFKNVYIPKLTIVIIIIKLIIMIIIMIICNYSFLNTSCSSSSSSLISIFFLPMNKAWDKGMISSGVSM